MTNRYSITTLILIILTNLGIHGQDNHDYATPVGDCVWFRDVRDANRTILTMSEIQPLSDGTTGLMALFNLRTDLSQVRKPLKLLSFTSGTEADSHLDIFYWNRTIILRRRLAPGSPYYYDYDLYDPMFTAESGDVTWEIKVFFTGYFFWIETRNTHKLLANKWHAPVFFGIDLPDSPFMESYLQRKTQSKIVFGDPQPGITFTMPDEVAIYEFKYTSLKDELQANFCND